jgi:HEAT repeat protein
MALKHVNPETRRETIEALVRERGANAVVDALRETATRDPAPAVKRAAIQVLASMNSPGAGEAVRAALGDPHPGVRWEAQKALAQQSRARASEGSVQ